jgi:hypothetical protein
MVKRSSTKRDFMQIAREVVEKAIGEHMDGTPLEPDTRDPHFVALGRKGGQKGGKARAETLSGKRRHEIAKRAAKKRWDGQT